MGFVNLANGNLHLEIPLGSFPQRGRVGFSAKLVYDSLVWQILCNGSSCWWSPTNGFTNAVSWWAGWKVVTTADGGAVTPTVARTNCSGGYYNVNSPFTWTGPDGTQHVFPITTQQDFSCGPTPISSGDAWAEDSTGYHMYVTNYTQAVVYGPGGTIAHDDTQTAYTVKDTNGNFFSTDSNGNVIDTLGRTLVQKTTSGWPAVYYDVLNSQGTTGRFTVNTALVGVNTAFHVSNVTEYSGQIRMVSSISLPDSTTYSFTYDSSYGLLASMTLPSGGTVSYGYTNFAASSNLWPYSNRWLSSRTSGAGTWNYTPASATGCPSGTYGCFKVTAQAPDTGTTVYTFATNNGAWNTQTVALATVVITYDFSNSCPSGCSGSAYIRKLSETSSLTSGGLTLNKQTQYAYDSPQNGNLTALKE